MKRKFEISAITNVQTFDDYLFRVKKLANARFKWKNIPDSWHKGFLENMLYYYGMAGCLNTRNYGCIISRASPYGNLDIYDLPSRCTCWSNAVDDTEKIRFVLNGLNDPLGSDLFYESMVLIANNYDLVPTYPTIQLFCKRLSKIDRVMDVNLNQQCTPMAIICTNKQRLALLNAYEQYDGNEPVIVIDKSLMSDGNAFRTIDTGAPYLLDKLQAQKQAIFAELLTFLGINTINYEKKERLIESETTANNQLIKLNVSEELECREKACKQINKYFDLNIDVEINENLENEIKNVSNLVNNVENGRGSNE